jgi:hypothetical protein
MRTSRIYTVRYWNHSQRPNHINDCAGNSHAFVTKAHGMLDALVKAKQFETGIFRLKDVVVEETSSEGVIVFVVKSEDIANPIA